MRAGLLVKNENQTVIISDSVETLEYIGKATYTGNDGGKYLNFPGYTGAYDLNLDGRIIYTYTMRTAGIPVVFIRPKEYDRYHTLLTQSQNPTDPTLWTFKIMVELSRFEDSVSRRPAAPSVYCFINSNDNISGNNDYGLIIYKEDGVTKTFDSNHQPLTVIDGFFTKPPVNPMNSGIPKTTSGHPWRDKTLDWDFGSGNANNYTSHTLTNSEPYTDLMFSASSIAQCCYKRQKNGYKKSDSQEHWSTAMWWGMYRNSFRFYQTELRSGWTIYAAGYTYTESYEDGGWFGGDAGGYTEGVMPYSAKTINLQDSMVMIADVKRFDPYHAQGFLTYHGPYYDGTNLGYTWQQYPVGEDRNGDGLYETYYYVRIYWGGILIANFESGPSSYTIGNTTYYRGLQKDIIYPYRGPATAYYEILKIVRS